MALASKSTAHLARGVAHVSKRLILSYVWDWICIIGIAAVGGGFNALHHTSKRTFVLQDPSIAYPNKPDIVSPKVLILVSLVAPAALTFILTFLFVPGAAAPKGTRRALIWRRKLWEWNTAWMGLGLALASAFMITEGLKDLAGKPRPHMLAVCRPNLAAIAQYEVGGLDYLSPSLGIDVNRAVPIMVDSQICQETDPATLRDAFASWPSGHSSFSWAGMLYLALWVSAKFRVTIPLLSPQKTTRQGQRIPTFTVPSTSKGGILTNGHESGTTEYHDETTEALLNDPTNPPRNQDAAPPVYLLILVFVPIGTAAFIATSRWADYHHHGFDVISGSLLGAFTAWFGFRYYHLPVRRGAGWSWGARSRGRAFWTGVGLDAYVGEEGWEGAKYSLHKTNSGAPKPTDLENGEPGPSAM